jgi:hypothetical protein
LSTALAVPAGCQNILNNGGFEYGMMCHNMFMSSYTGVDFAGDYRFSLSTSAHSGNYAGQITCTGSDCLRAQISSNHIPLTNPGQSYQISLWANCGNNETAQIYIPGTVGGDTTKYLPCALGAPAWAQTQFTFQPGNSASYFYYEIFYLGQTTLLIDDIVLTYADGTAPAHTLTYPGVRNTGISGNAVTVDGAPFLALGFFDVEYADLGTVAALGANTLNGLNFSNNADCYNIGQPSFLDKLYSLGMNFVPDSSDAARLPTTAEFPSIAQRFAPHLANIAWFLDDEPDLWSVAWVNVTPATLIAQSTALKTQTNLPVHADFQRSHYSVPSDDAPYAPAVDFWMGEPYGSDFSTLSYNVNFFNSIAPRPIWLAQDNPGPGLIVPKAYWAIVNGVTGIFYFSWTGFGTDTVALPQVSQVFSELTALKNVIFGAKIDNQVTAPSGITTMSRYYQGTNYILAVNPATTTITGTFSVQGLASGQTVTVLNESRTITSVAGGFSDTFTGIARHVYTIPNPAPPTVTSVQVLFGSQSYTVTGSTRQHLPWQINGIRVTFSRPITTASTSSLTGVTATGLTGVGTNTLTWTFNPVSLGTFTATLSGSGPNALMDGSGNTLLADYPQLLKVLWGDFNDDGVVNSQDTVLVNNARVGPYNQFADMNGDGVVNTADVTIVRGRIGTIN